jgi:hypothetical protein
MIIKKLDKFREMVNYNDYKVCLVQAIAVLNIRKK